MITKDDWRLTPTVEAFLIVGTDRKLVYLAAGEKKQYKNAVLKQITSPSYREVHVGLNEFDLKFAMEEFEDSLVAYVKNTKAFGDDSWYKVMNFSSRHKDMFFAELNSFKGAFPDCTFEAIFSESNPAKVSFSTTEMSNYRDFASEMRRRLNCEYGKKCKKWIPGHRYDTIKETYYYLGTLRSRRAEELNSNFLDDGEMVPVHLYVNDISEEEKTISDVLKNRTFGSGDSDIKVMYAFPSAVDSEAGLVDDFNDGDIRDFWETMLDNSIKKCTRTNEFGYVDFSGIKRVFDIFCYQSEYLYEYPEPTSALFTKLGVFLREVLDSTVLATWNLTGVRKDLCLMESMSDEEKVRSLIKNLYFSTLDVNTARYAYYEKMMSTLSIPIEKIALSALASFSESNLMKDFGTYVKYSEYFDRRKVASEITVKQRVNTTQFKLETNKVSEVFGSNNLSNLLIEMATFAKGNYGSGVSSYLIYNIGTKSKPLEYINMEISLADIIKWYKGVDNIPASVKSDIISGKFTKAIIVIDKDKDVE